jgi:putative ABC transport system substrate-binding protein
MRRRQFITFVGGAAASLPIAARTQERMRRIGMLMGATEGDIEGERWVQAFLQSMQALGWQRDTNVQIAVRWGASNLDRMATFAKELVASQPDLIQVTTTPATAAILRETRIIPVVFAIVSDPVGSGFVQSLSHPGGNVTGFINVEALWGVSGCSCSRRSRPALPASPCCSIRTPRPKRTITGERLNRRVERWES